MEKESKVKSFTQSPHFVYILIIVGLIVFTAFKNKEWNEQIKNEKNLQKELREKNEILVSAINSNNEENEIIQNNIDQRTVKIDSLKKAIKKIRRSDFRSVPFDQRNRAIEIKAAEE